MAISDTLELLGERSHEIPDQLIIPLPFDTSEHRIASSARRSTSGMAMRFRRFRTPALSGSPKRSRHAAITIAFGISRHDA